MRKCGVRWIRSMMKRNLGNQCLVYFNLKNWRYTNEPGCQETDSLMFCTFCLWNSTQDKGLPLKFYCKIRKITTYQNIRMSFMDTFALKNSQGQNSYQNQCAKIRKHCLNQLWRKVSASQIIKFRVKLWIWNVQIYIRPK